MTDSRKIEWSDIEAGIDTKGGKEVYGVGFIQVGSDDIAEAKECGGDPLVEICDASAADGKPYWVIGTMIRRDPSLVLAKKSKALRNKILRKFYDWNHNNPGKPMKLWVDPEAEGVSTAECEAALRSIKNKGWLAQQSLAGDAVITEAGIEHVEDIMQFPNNTGPLRERTTKLSSGSNNLGRPAFPIEHDRNTSETTPTRIFIVHGHNEAMKSAVARMLEKLGLEPIILHEQAAKGRTIIEKFDAHANVPFAVVLLSPDDIGRSRNDTTAPDKFRARQNVVFELGYFIGKLGRDKVLSLLEVHADFDAPSDISGVEWVPFDAHGAWQHKLMAELKAAGFDVDANKLYK